MDVPEAILERIHAVMHQVRGQQLRALNEAVPGLSHMEGRVLAHFARHPDSTQRELIGKTGRDKGQVARLVAALKERGWLVGSPDAHDRRVERLSLSEEGRVLHTVFHRERRQIARRAASALTPVEQQQLLTLLDTLQHTLAEG